MMLGVDDRTKQCIVSVLMDYPCVSVGLLVGYSPERWAQRREASRRCLSDAVVKSHQELEAYNSFAMMTAR